MSENGPREGTRDLPRPGPDAGRRAIEEDSHAGVAYGTLSRSLRRRRAELVALMDAGGTPSSVATAYQAEHPLEPAVTAEEIEVALGEARGAGARPSLERLHQRRSPARKSGTRT